MPNIGNGGRVLKETRRTRAILSRRGAPLPPEGTQVLWVPASSTHCGVTGALGPRPKVILGDDLYLS